jgi:uncharacterized protein YgiM (DUF1202 family)
MKLNVWNLWIISVCAPLTAAVVMAQEAAPATPAKAGKGGLVKVVLNPPATAVVKSANVNLRGLASFKGETVGHLQKGDTVTVLEQITLGRHKKDEPADWAKIVMPASDSVWVASGLIDDNTKTIKVRRAHLRGGPGENYSVLGTLEKGTTVKETKSEKGWVAIEAPTNAFAYVAAEFLDVQPAPAVVSPPAAPAPEPQVVAVNTPAPPITAPAPEPVAPAPTTPENDTARELEALHRATGTADTNASAATSPASITDASEPRIVTREGFVRRTYNVQTPTIFELRDIQSGKLMDFLDPKTGVDFKIFVGTRVIVKGPEGVDARWPRTPVLTVQTVDLMP